MALTPSALGRRAASAAPMPPGRAPKTTALEMTEVDTLEVELPFRPLACPERGTTDGIVAGCGIALHAGPRSYPTQPRADAQCPSRRPSDRSWEPRSHLHGALSEGLLGKIGRASCRERRESR